MGRANDAAGGDLSKIRPMRLDHLLNADGLGCSVTAEQRLHVAVLLPSLGFVRTPDAFELDETFAWVSVTDTPYGYHVAVQEPLPSHLFEQAMDALDALKRVVGVRVDPLTRARIDSFEWAARVHDASNGVMRGRFP